MAAAHVASTVCISSVLLADREHCGLEEDDDEYNVNCCQFRMSVGQRKTGTWPEQVKHMDICVRTLAVTYEELRLGQLLIHASSSVRHTTYRSTYIDPLKIGKG
jgi:hypothetical protein